MSPLLRPITLERQLGQLLLVGFRGVTPAAAAPFLQKMAALNFGGVVLFDVDVPSGSPGRNIESPTQLRKLTAALQEAAPTPLLIAVDQEGGRVARLNPERGFPPTVSHQELGSRDCLSHTRRSARVMAQTLADAGINLNFAPCVDVNLNPHNPIIGAKERSFSADPAVVARHAVEFIAAHQEYGVLCALKHFPGHGSSRGDSHLGLVDVTECWSPDELSPFRTLIERDCVDMVMTAHIFNRCWDSNSPATLSPAVIDGMLRSQMGYQGAVITDDLQMGAIAQHFGLETAVERAIIAGADLLMFANNSAYDAEIGEKVIDILLRLIQEKRLTVERLEQSWARIRRLKTRLAKKSA